MKAERERGRTLKKKTKGQKKRDLSPIVFPVNYAALMSQYKKEYAGDDLPALALLDCMSHLPLFRKFWSFVSSSGKFMKAYYWCISLPECPS